MISGFTINRHIDSLSDDNLKVACLIAPNQRRFLSDQENFDHIVWANQSVFNLNGRRIDNIRCSDGHLIDTIFFQGIHPISHQPIGLHERTIIFIGGMGYYHYQLFSIMEMFRQQGCNVLSFHYRGVGTSEGELKTQNDIIKAGQAVIDYLVRVHFVPQDQIVLHSFSMGATFAPSIAATRAKVSVVSDRSMACIAIGVDSLEESVKQRAWNLGIGHGINIHFTNWPQNPLGDWSKITGRKCVVYHMRDLFFPHAQLSFCLMAQGETNTRFVQLIGGDDHPFNPHGRPYTTEEFQQIFRAIFPNPSNEKIQEHRPPVQTSFQYFLEHYRELRRNHPFSPATALVAAYIGSAPEATLWQLLALARNAAEGRPIPHIPYFRFSCLSAYDFAIYYRILWETSNQPFFKDIVIQERELARSYFYDLVTINRARNQEINRHLGYFPSFSISCANSCQLL